MSDWILRPDDPTLLTLAVDARFNTCNYLDDQIWEFAVGRGEPPAITLQTTLGLRARNLRIFPRFGEGDWIFNDPARFETPITITHYYPNYLRLTFSPIPGIPAVLEYWVPDSRIITGRVLLRNITNTARNIRMEWAAILSPTEQGQQMIPEEMEATSVLVGRTGNLETIFIHSGGPHPGSGAFSSLETTPSLPVGSEQTFTWVFCAQPGSESPFKIARQWITHSWDPHIARIHRVNDGLFEIHTGNPAWDRAFEYSQKTAYRLFIKSGDTLPYPSFVACREPDHGYSLAGDGSDYGSGWKGQSPLEAYYLARLVLPAAADLAKGLLLNFLSIQHENGWIGLIAGLIAQRNSLLATPVLSSLAWQIYRSTEDRSFLITVFPDLLRFLNSWFASSQDQDGDGIPEWTHSQQTGSENHPLFSHHLSDAAGLDIQKVESPDLCSFLYRECQLLIKIAHEIGQLSPIPDLEARCEQLRSAIEASWCEGDHAYHYWDRDAHTTSQGSQLAVVTGPGEAAINQQFDQPVRLLITIHSASQSNRWPQVFLHGTSPSGTHRIERISPEQFDWRMDRGFATSERTYLELEHVEFLDIQEADQAEISIVDMMRLDQSLFMPIWAGIPNEERQQYLLKDHLLNPESFLSAAGILPCPVDSLLIHKSDTTFLGVYALWNTLICEGLVENHKRVEAVEIFNRLMNAISSNLAREGSFRSRYHYESGFGSGERNSLLGLAPLGVFMDILGLRIINSRRIFLEGINPFDWPITVKYKGTTVYRQKEKTTVIFPDGQTVTINEPGACWVTLE